MRSGYFLTHRLGLDATRGLRLSQAALRSAVSVALLCLLSGCSTVGYYSQIVTGHMKVVVGKKTLDEIVAAPSTDDLTRHKLNVAQKSRIFAITQLGLPDNGSYTSFYDTQQNYITWNVVASEEFSFQARRWCFPIAGCVSYRGYYAEEDANAYAASLAEQGLDVAVNGATAYSTLGWFADPLLNTMLNRSDSSITSLLFHELAHQQLYVADDSKFNESFASFVEGAGVEYWQEVHSDENSTATEALRQRRHRQKQFIGLLGSARTDLETIYDSALSDSEKRAKKTERFTSLRDEYEQLKVTWGGYPGYDAWFSRKLNNARLVSVATYNDYIPAFRVLFEESGSDFKQFYAAAKALADMEREPRTAAMKALLAKGDN